MGRPRNFHCGNYHEYANGLPADEVLVFYRLWFPNYFTPIEQDDW